MNAGIEPARRPLMAVASAAFARRGRQGLVVTGINGSLELNMKFTKLAVASACIVVVGCGGSSQPDEVVSPDSQVTLEQAERFDQAERLRWRQTDGTAPEIAVTTQAAVDAGGSVGISGTVSDDKAVYSVKWTNDRGGSGSAALAGTAKSATWSAAGIQLQTGSNTITLVAEDVAGNSATTTTVVSRDAVTTETTATTQATTSAPAVVAGGAKPPAVARTVTCANGSKISQAAGYYASGSKWVLGSFLPQCPSGGATPAAAPAPAATPAPRPAPAPVSVPAPTSAAAPTPTSPAPSPAPAATPTPAPAPSATTTYVNAALVPAPIAGSPDRRISNTGEMPYRDPDGMGAFRTVCNYSHMNFDDPLVYPGQAGKAHLHVFFGNTGVNANSTPESIRTTGNGSCRGGIVNRSAYWAPAMVDSSTGQPIRPNSNNDIYYKTGYSLFGQNSQVKALPVGFRMIALDSKSRTPQSKAHFECNGAQTPTIPNCPNGELKQVVSFPQCWDGVNLDSPDHRSHVVYANNGSCPATHPVHFPEISIIIKYTVPASGSANWRLSSDINGTPAGSSSHADWVNGWEQEVMNTFISRVVGQGLSGGSHIIGDGRTIY